MYFLEVFNLPSVLIEGRPFFSDSLNTASDKDVLRSSKSFLVILFLASAIEKVLPLFSSKNVFLLASDIFVVCCNKVSGVIVVASGSSNDCPISNAAALFTFPCAYKALSSSAFSLTLLASLLNLSTVLIASVSDGDIPTIGLSIWSKFKIAKEPSGFWV